MVLVNVLKRKDASSVIVAIVVALIVVQFLSAFTANWPNKILGMGGQGIGWKTNYAVPVVALIVELLVLEVLGWIYVWAAGAMKKK